MAPFENWLCHPRKMERASNKFVSLSKVKITSDPLRGAMAPGFSGPDDKALDSFRRKSLCRDSILKWSFSSRTSLRGEKARYQHMISKGCFNPLPYKSKKSFTWDLQRDMRAFPYVGNARRDASAKIAFLHYLHKSRRRWRLPRWRLGSHVYPLKPYAESSHVHSDQCCEIWPITDRASFASLGHRAFFPYFDHKWGISCYPQGIGTLEDVILYITWMVWRRCGSTWPTVLRNLLSGSPRRVVSGVYMLRTSRAAKHARAHYAACDDKGVDADAQKCIELLVSFWALSEANRAKFAIQVNPQVHRYLKHVFQVWCSRVTCRSILVRALRIGD